MTPLGGTAGLADKDQVELCAVVATVILRRGYVQTAAERVIERDAPIGECTLEDELELLRFLQHSDGGACLLRFPVPDGLVGFRAGWSVIAMSFPRPWHKEKRKCWCCCRGFSFIFPF